MTYLRLCPWRVVHKATKGIWEILLAVDLARRLQRDDKLSTYNLLCLFLVIIDFTAITLNSCTLYSHRQIWFLRLDARTTLILRRTRLHQAGWMAHLGVDSSGGSIHRAQDKHPRKKQVET